MRALIRGFRTPAPCGDGRAGSGAGVRKPPKEETAGRKGRRLVGRGPMEILGSQTAGVGRRGGWCVQSWRRDRRRQACLVARLRGPGAGAAVGGGLATSRGHRLSAPARDLLSLPTRDGVGLGLCDCADFVAGGFMDGALNLAGRHIWAAFRLERASIAVALDGAIANSAVLQHAVAGLVKARRYFRNSLPPGHS